MSDDIQAHIEVMNTPPDLILSLENMMQTVKALGPRPQSEFRASSQTIALIGCELAARTPASRLPEPSLDGPLKIGSPEHFGMYGITIEVDETVPYGQLKPAFPQPSFDFTSMRLKHDMPDL